MADAQKKSVKVSDPARKNSKSETTEKAKAAAKKSANRKGKSGSDKPYKRKTITMMEWSDIKFIASAQRILGFSGLSISGSCETEDTETDSEKYVSLKNKKGFEISLTAYFDKRLGIEKVRDDALALVGYACAGMSDYLYLADKKLVPTLMMATSAKIQNVHMTPEMGWISCEVALTFKSSSKLDGSTTGTGDGSGGGGYTAYVTYMVGSGAKTTVSGYSTKSYDDALAKAWAKVPANATWAKAGKDV